MEISIDDIRETAIDALSRLGMELPFTVELVCAEGFLMAQPTGEAPSGFVDEEGVVLPNAIDPEPLIEYLLGFVDCMAEQTTYLVADAVEEGYRIRLGCDD